MAHGRESCDENIAMAAKCGNMCFDPNPVSLAETGIVVTECAKRT